MHAVGYDGLRNREMIQIQTVSDVRYPVYDIQEPRIISHRHNDDGQAYRLGIMEPSACAWERINHYAKRKQPLDVPAEDIKIQQQRRSGKEINQLPQKLALQKAVYLVARLRI